MKKKKEILVPGVTTYEALLSAVDQNACILGIEEPLYTEFVQGVYTYDILKDYSLEEHRSRGFVLARKVRGRNRFHAKRYDFRYVPYDIPEELFRQLREKRLSH